MENIQFKAGDYMGLMTPWLTAVSSVWAEHDLGKCWAKFPAPCAGDTLLVSPVPRSCQAQVQVGWRSGEGQGKGDEEEDAVWSPGSVFIICDPEYDMINKFL